MDLEPRDREAEMGSLESVGEPLAAALASSLCFRGGTQPISQPFAPGEPFSPMELSPSRRGIPSQQEDDAKGGAPPEHAPPLPATERGRGISGSQGSDSTGAGHGALAVPALVEAGAATHVLTPAGSALGPCPMAPCGITGFFGDPWSHGAMEPDQSMAGASQDTELTRCLGKGLAGQAFPEGGVGPGAPGINHSQSGHQLQALNAESLAGCVPGEAVSGMGPTNSRTEAAAEGKVKCTTNRPLQATGLAPPPLHPMPGSIQADAFPSKEEGEDGGAGLPLDGAQRDQILHWDTSRRGLSSQISAEALRLRGCSTTFPTSGLPETAVHGSCSPDPVPFLSLASLMHEEQRSDA